MITELKIGGIRLKQVSRGGLGVERLLQKKCHSGRVDRIPLGETIPAMSMFYVYKFPTLTDLCYKYE